MNNDNSMNESKDTLRIFLKEEIENAKKRLDSLKGSLKIDDFNTLDEELKERSETLDSVTDEDETQLFVLRREIGLLQENMESLAVKQGWWSRLPIYARIMIITVPVILYLLVLSLIQWFNKGQIYDYPATQTAVAELTTTPNVTATSTATFTATP